MGKEGHRSYATFLESACAKAWAKIGAKRRAGVTTPLFSIYSERSIGIGEAPDLKELVDWCKATGLSIIQLLPLNDVGFEFRPYDSQSSLALDPMHLSLMGLSGCDLAVFTKDIEALRKRFPAGKSRVNYEIKRGKLELLRRIFDHASTSRKEKKFLTYIKKHKAWLEDYAVYKTLKGSFNHAGWMDWPEEFRTKDTAVLGRFMEGNRSEILFHQWLQWQLFEQFAASKRYAAKHGVLLMGDMPFLVSRDSADVWSRQDYFKLDRSSGAPPDLYFAQGQRWGMPPYDWERIAEDGYDYLVRKMQYLEHFFDMYRIDHFVGMFRLWTIDLFEPLEHAGMRGTFDPAEESLWKEHGKKILDVMVERTGMLPCAEDLGVVPPCSYEVLEEYRIPGSDVQRWLRNWGKDYQYRPVDTHRLNGMAMLSTHDTSPFCAYWEHEAGTVDEWFFRKKCQDAHLHFDDVQSMLFQSGGPVHGRLRWRPEILNQETLLAILRRSKDEAWHLVDAFMSTYNERELYWQFAGMHGHPGKKVSHEFMRKALETVNASHAVFSLQLLQDWLALGDYKERDAWEYRINVPGTMGPGNWSLVAPHSLEQMQGLQINPTIREIVTGSGRLAP
ncbi:MAG: 4-alpha-glucanotransferase [Candidatus Omnitrophica bacterium]|nr:4-alpha-glucanotransferase [Candidatus Omnitrophota bacterium]